jgi:hypothetical protein
MAFPENIVRARWKLAGGTVPPNPSYCECVRTTHDHNSRKCNKQLTWANRGREDKGAWEAHHLGSPTDDSLANCRIYCWSCHKATF